MNIKDICLLKKVNFSRRPKTIDFFREKTKETSKGDLIQIHVDLFPMTIEIIDRWGSKDHDNPYLFPFLVSDRGIDEVGSKNYAVSARRKKTIANSLIKDANESLKRASLALNLSFRLRFNDVRDTQSSALAKAGAPLVFSAHLVIQPPKQPQDT